MPGLFFEFHFPIELVTLARNLLTLKGFDQSYWSSKSQSVPIDTSTREWFSQPRPSTDGTTEVVTINFKLPLSVSEMSVEVLRRSCHTEVWYKDRSNNWMQMRDRQRVPLGFNVSHSAVASWYKYGSLVYPIVAKAVQLRITRLSDPEVAGRPYSVGVRNTLIKRNVYERNQGVQHFEDEQDVLGDVMTKYVKDWDATKAIDADAQTFWRSAPQPDPAAVVSLYLDIRTTEGNPQAIDKLYLDPVYTGQQLNLYYSSDDTVGVRKLSPVSIYPDIDINTDWRAGRGRWDISAVSGVAAFSQYKFAAHWGPKVEQAAWIGLEWLPDFDPLSGPSQEPVLFGVTPTVTTNAWWPQITYDPGAGAFELHFKHNTAPEVVYTAPLSQVFEQDQPVRLIVGWAYNPQRIIIRAVNHAGEVLTMLTPSASALPDLVSFDGTLGFHGFRGIYTATIVKLQDWAAGQGEAYDFLTNPIAYVSPDPVLVDDSGNTPPSSLDGAILSADWTQQSEAVGGMDASEFGSKEWTPIWRNYVAAKGDIFLPQMLTAKYLKLEFTNLTEEPYPIYESGIQTTYKVFPISVQQVASLGPRLTGQGITGLANLAVNGIALNTVNWFDPKSVLGVVNAAITPQYEPVRVDAGPGYVTDTMPNTADGGIIKSYQVELSSSRVYRREMLDPYVIAQDQLYTIIKGEGLAKIAPYTTIPWEEIYAANPGAIDRASSPGSLPVRGTDWWLFPGQQLRIPARVMERLTDTSTVTERRLTLESRVRFTTTAVHRYDIRTVTRDAAIAYFAGVREVVPSVASYTYGIDRDQFDFPFYAPEQWTFKNIAVTGIGTVTYDGSGGQGQNYGSMFFNLQTYSNFAKVDLVFRDSGLMRSNAMWASEGSDKLSPYVHLIPASLDGSSWADYFAEWKDTDVAWGAKRSVVSINLDGDRRYQGRRVLHFARVPGAGEAGLAVDQTVNYIPGALVRLGCVVYKPFGNDNQIILRLVRTSDSVVIYETRLSDALAAPVGRWLDYQTEMIEVPAGGSQQYQVQLVLSGDDEDELYVSDLYTELTHIRYFARLGGGGGFLHEVTDLRFRQNAVAAVVAPTPVNQCSLYVNVLSDRAFAYGATAVPQYLQ